MNRHHINCKNFKRQASEWLGGRLSAQQSQKMLCHREECEPCALDAREEAQIRQSWEERAAAIPAVDFWPRLSVHLGERERIPAHSHRPITCCFPRWAAGGVVVLTVLAVFGLHQFPYETTMTGRGDASRTH